MSLSGEVWFLHLRTCLIKTSFLAKSENLRPCSSLRDKRTNARTDGRTDARTHIETHAFYNIYALRYALARALKISVKSVTNQDLLQSQNDQSDILFIQPAAKTKKLVKVIGTERCSTLFVTHMNSNRKQAIKPFKPTIY
jgi:hypothetical protein